MDQFFALEHHGLGETMPYLWMQFVQEQDGIILPFGISKWCRRGKISFLYVSMFLAKKSPVIKERLTGNKRKFRNICMLYRQERPRKISSLKWPSLHLKYHLQLKTKMLGERGGAVRGGYQERHSKQEHVLSADLSCHFTPLIRVSRDLVILHHLVKRGRNPCKWKFPS